METKRDFIHTYDMAKAVIFLLENFAKEIDIFNLGRGIKYSVIDVVKAFERQIGEEILIEVEPTRVRKVERMHLLADICKLKSLICWEPTISLDEGIKNLVSL